MTSNKIKFFITETSDTETLYQSTQILNNYKKWEG